MAKILVSDSLAEEGRSILADGGANEVVYKPDITPEDLLAEIGEYDALVIRSRTQVPAEVLQAGKNLKIVGRAGVGVDNVDIPAATECGIMVANAPDGNTVTTCEHAISLLMSLARHVPEGDATMKDGQWAKKKLAGVELFGKVLGVIGLGKIGREVARRMKAFGMTVWGADPFVSSEVAEKMGLTLKTVDEIVAGADVITIHTPKTPDTVDMIGEAQLKKMKKSALLVNCARGGIVNEKALAEALEAGEIAGAALDVYTEEPLPEDHFLRKAPRLVLTPHLGASTAEAQEKVALQVAEQVVNACKGAEVTTALNAPPVNSEVLKQAGPALQLAEKLGRFIVQLAGDAKINKLEIVASGNLLDHPIDLISMSVMKGYLEHISDIPVNFVNARSRMKDQGIEVEENKRSAPKDYLGLLSVVATTETGDKENLSGTVFAPNRPRVVAIGGLHFEMRPEGNVLLLHNDDIPGIIGAVGTTLGNAGLNIGEISWGRDQQGGRAMTAINIDGDVSGDIVKTLEGLEGVRSAKLIKL